MQTIIHFYTDTQKRETALVLAQVIKKFLVAATNFGLTAQILHKTLGSENNSILDAYIMIEGDQHGEFTKSWTGTIRWIAKSQFSKVVRESSWFVGSEIWTENIVFSFSLNDVDFHTMRSSGPGGQHVNKVSTAVRAIHNPTGIQVSASDSRSQSKNKDLALQRLKEKVLECHFQKLLERLKSNSKSPATLHENRVVRTFRGTDFKKESTKKPIKKERQRSKIEIKKKNYYEHD